MRFAGDARGWEVILSRARERGVRVRRVARGAVWRRMAGGIHSKSRSRVCSYLLNPKGLEHIWGVIDQS